MLSSFTLAVKLHRLADSASRGVDDSVNLRPVTGSTAADFIRTLCQMAVLYHTAMRQHSRHISPFSGMVYMLQVYCSRQTAAQSTYIPRVPQCPFLRLNWDPPPPLPQARVSTPRNQRGGHTRLRVRGWGVPIWTSGKNTLRTAAKAPLILLKYKIITHKSCFFRKCSVVPCEQEPN